MPVLLVQEPHFEKQTSNVVLNRDTVSGEEAFWKFVEAFYWLEALNTWGPSWDAVNSLIQQGIVHTLIVYRHDPGH